MHTLEAAGGRQLHPGWPASGPSSRSVRERQLRRYGLALEDGAGPGGDVTGANAGGGANGLGTPPLLIPAGTRPWSPRQFGVHRIRRARKLQLCEFALEARPGLRARIPLADGLDVEVGAQDHERRRELLMLLDEPVRWMLALACKRGYRPIAGGRRTPEVGERGDQRSVGGCDLDSKRHVRRCARERLWTNKSPPALRDRVRCPWRRRDLGAREIVGIRPSGHHRTIEVIAEDGRKSAVGVAL